MNDRPPGSSRCTHRRYITKRFNPRVIHLYCAICGVLAGWWTDSQDNINYDDMIQGAPTELSEEEKERLA